MRNALAVTARNAANELRGLATHAAVYPLGLLGGALRPAPAVGGEQLNTPVVLVHGYFHNRSGFFVLARALRQRGFRWVYAMNYNPLGESIPSLAHRLDRHVEDVQRISGTERVHVVGHSLGGLVARWYVQEMDGARHVARCVTLGTPHRGTLAAHFGIGEAAAQMRPGSRVLRRLENGFPKTTTSFFNLYSDLDGLILPTSSGILPERGNVRNELLRDFGHTSMLLSSQLVSAVTGELSSAEDDAHLAEVRPLRRATGR